MSGPYGTRWADIDEPPEVVAEEDAKFFTALGIWNAQHAMRPPEPGEEVLPGTFRASVVDLYRSMDEVEAKFRSTWRGRVAWWLLHLRWRMRKQ